LYGCLGFGGNKIGTSPAGSTGSTATGTTSKQNKDEPCDKKYDKVKITMKYEKKKPVGKTVFEQFPNLSKRYCKTKQEFFLIL
jgi:hypothetical protein